MKYLLLDTNILIDMLVYREKGNKSESYSLLIKLIDYGKVKLIVPPIVQTEIFNHIDNEINKIGNNIKNIKRSTANLYWINHADKLKEFNTTLHPIKTGISFLNEKFKREKESYIIESHEIVNKILKHKNSIIVDEPSEIIDNVLRRKLHKKKPFDKKEDAFADAVIIESLINIDKLIDFSSEDCLFLITRNYVDFSAENNKDDLHEDIQCILDHKGLHNVFYRRFFAKTLNDDLHEEVQEAKIIDELELERSNEEEFYNMEYFSDKIASERDSADLLPLGGDYEEIISEYAEIYDLINYISDFGKRISTLYDDYLDIYDNTISEIVHSKDEVQSEYIDHYNKNSPIIPINTDADLKSEIQNVIDFYCVNPFEYDFSDSFSHSDYFEFDSALMSLVDVTGVTYVLNIIGELNPTNDGVDTLYARLYRDDTIICECNIDIIYGFIEIDGEHNVGDGLESSITFRFEALYSHLERISDRIYSDLNKSKIRLEKLIDNFNFKLK